MEEFIKEEICDYLNNVECEEYCKLTEEQINEIAENIYSNVMGDSELNDVLNSTIEWYANHYISKNF